MDCGLKRKALIAWPTYLYVNFRLMVAFKIEQPMTVKLDFILGALKEYFD